MNAGFDEVAQQLPRFDIDRHGNRLDKPLDPYGALTDLAFCFVCLMG